MKNLMDEMILEVLLVLPLYTVIFVIIVRSFSLIKAMTEANDILSGLSPETPDEYFSSVDKRDFLLEKLQNGETISNSETPLTE